LSSIREGITPETDIYDALRKAVATNLDYDPATRKSILEMIASREKGTMDMQTNMQALYKRFPELKDQAFRSQLLKEVGTQQQVSKQ
jgi:hypothetical protein